MKVYAINGSPRKNKNTAILLNKALEGAASQGADTEMVHLYDINFKGCQSCMACKNKNSGTFGKCAMRDELTPVLDKLKDAGAIIMGSPVYYGAATGEMRSFFERFCFPYMQYSKKETILFDRKIPTGSIYTMNATKRRMRMFRGQTYLRVAEFMLKLLTQHSETLFAYNTYQVDDYSKYVFDAVDVAKKEKSRRKLFPKDCQKAYDMGVRFAKGDVKYKKVKFF